MHDMEFKRKHAIVSGIVLVTFIGTVITVFDRGVKADQGEQPARPAAVALVHRAPLSSTLTLSGEFRPFQEVEVHAKVAGYIRVIHVDVGDHVRQGQVIAVLEVPELQAELQGTDAAVRRSKDAVRRAKSDLQRADSAHEVAHLNYARLKEASSTRPGIIAQQELDDAEAKDKESEAQVSSSQAALSEAENQLDVALAGQKQYSALSSYTSIVAPFDGVVTKRYADTGALIQAGTSSNTQAMPVVRVAETEVFRLTLPVPESAVPQVHIGSVVQVHVQALGRTFEGKVARFADSVDEDTRTMHTEVDVRNQDYSLVQGMYAEVSLTLAHREAVLTIPVQAVSRNGSESSVLRVDAHNRLEERPVQLGLEGTSSIEVLAGLREGDAVLIGSRGQFRAGDRVAPQVIADHQEADY
jgi:RND family efflux transporter MFP subunit